MSTVILLDISESEFYTLYENTPDLVKFVDTMIGDIAVSNEYQRISSIVRSAKSTITAVRFSGNMNVVSRLGDNYSDMIITISSNPEHPYYTNNTKESFERILNIFFEEMLNRKNM